MSKQIQRYVDPNANLNGYDLQNPNREMTQAEIMYAAMVWKEQQQYEMQQRQNEMYQQQLQAYQLQAMQLQQQNNAMHLTADDLREAMRHIKPGQKLQVEQYQGFEINYSQQSSEGLKNVFGLILCAIILGAFIFGG